MYWRVLLVPTVTTAVVRAEVPKATELVRVAIRHSAVAIVDNKGDAGWDRW